MTLGRATGAVLLGKPLTFSIGLQMDAEEAEQQQCFDAEVFYGEQRQESSKVKVTPLPVAGGRATRLNVVSLTSVDEPVVTVYVRAGCVAKTTRKYVLLSELESDLLPPATETTSPNPVRFPLPVPRDAGVIAKPQAAVVSDAALPAVQFSAPRAQAPVKVKRVQEGKAAPRPVVSPTPASVAKPRLKLSMLDLVDIKDPSLRLTHELAAFPTDDAKQRELAAAAWRLLNMTAQDIVLADTSQKALSSDLQKLKEITAKNLQDQQELSKRLLLAESERFSNPLVIGLGLLAVGALIAMVVMWLKARQQASSEKPWWGGVGAPNDRTLSSADLDSPVTDEPVTLPPSPADVPAGDTNPSHTPVSASKPEFKPAPQVLDIDLGLDAHPEPQASTMALASPTAGTGLAAAVTRKGSPAGGGRRDFSQSLNATLHAINTTEMLDVRQQADFFMTLGQHEEAIRVLEENINLSGSSNPLVFLDLLKVLHTLSKKREFDQYRAEFNTIFTGGVPEFQSFHRPGRTLESYPEICEEITKLWGTDDVIDYLEDCLIRTEEDQADDYFELNAYRDLLTLHALASRILAQSPSESSLVPFSATRSDRATDSVIDSGGMVASLDAEPTMPLLTTEAGEYSEGVDLDLSEGADNLIHYDISEFQLTPKK